MKTYLSATLLNNLQHQTENILEKAIREWQMVSPAKFNQNPAPGAWSAAQCLAHLNSYGDYYLPAIETAIREAKQKKLTASRQFTPGTLGNYFTNLMMPKENGLPSKKMKAPKNHIPENTGNSDEIIATFIEQQERLVQLMEQAAGVDLNKTKVPISIAKFIRLKLGDVFMFLIAHNTRHILQAERALQSAGVQTMKIKAA